MRKKELKMQIRYEINRLSKNHLSAAYEKLIPVITHQIESKEISENHLNRSDIKHTESLDEQFTLSNDVFSCLKRNNQ
jgi:hypothetical protein